MYMLLFSRGGDVVVGRHWGRVPAGGTAVITLQNPLSTPLTALVSHGSRERQVSAGPLAGGAMNENQMGGTRGAAAGRRLRRRLGLVLLVAAADELRTHIGADAGVPRQAALPTSPLFDPRAPMLAADTVTLNVAERTAASLTLSVCAGGGRRAATAPPPRSR